ncbi:unnamed protein product [Strongylus vulgaris]|uniref:Uncharacterized protein n=1 Tax=Strongylus vulgaris TaxID=40348 RepID=A0A3P7IYW8_STRVU|nr:unnamed protein product [Strongylus vulgaris]
MLCGVASTEGLASPITIAMYNWTYEEAILYNGILQVVSCGMSTLTYALTGSTRIGTWDRSLVLALGLSGFSFAIFVIILCHSMKVLSHDHKSVSEVNGTVATEAGGCSYKYEWCEYTPRECPIPLFQLLLILYYPKLLDQENK